MLPDPAVDPFPDVGAMHPRLQLLLDVDEDSGDVVVDLTLELGGLADREGAAEIGPVAAVLGPGVDDVELVLLDHAIPG